MEKIHSLKELDLHNKKVLMRVDFNVPLDKTGTILDDSRIRAALPSINYILNQGGALILMSHLGRPKSSADQKCSLRPCAQRLSELLKKPVSFATESTGGEAEQKASTLKPGELLLLENLRFHEGEENPEKEPSFVKKLASLGEIYVNDAFGTAHRAHASTALIAQYFPERAAPGFLMEKEVAILEDMLKSPKKPFYAIIGGAKISSKIGILKALLNKVDKLFIGGAMSYTFLKAQGMAIGNSLCEEDSIAKAKAILELGKKLGKEIYLPSDHLIAQEVKNDAETRIVSSKEGIPPGFMGVDIGPKTITTYSQLLEKGNTLFWNGPMGIFECKNFAKGTNAIAQTLAKSQGTTIVGGGESVAAVEAAGVADKITHLSTGGGATLEYIEFGTLPGITALIR